MPKLATQTRLETAAVVASAYLVVGLLQTSALLKMDPDATPLDALLASVLFAALLFPTTYLASGIDPERLPMLSRVLRDRRSILKLARILPYALGLGVLAFAVNVALSGLLSRVWMPPTTQEYVRDLSILEKFLTALSSGIWEETIFRLFLVSAIFAALGRRTISYLVPNLMFALMHLVFQNPPYNPPALLVVFAIGLVYTKSYLDRGLETAIVCHATMNFLTMTVGMLA